MNSATQSSRLGQDPRYQDVLKTLRSLRRRDLFSRMLGGLGRIFGYMLLSLTLRSLLDYWLHFGWGSRVALLSLDLIIVLWLSWRYLVVPFRRRLGILQAALHLQGCLPELRSQLIATVQLVPKVDAGLVSHSLVGRLLEQTDVLLKQLNWKGTVPLKPRLKWVLLPGMLFLGLLLVGLSYPSTSMALFARYFLSTRPPLYDTQIQVLPGNQRLARGSTVNLLADLSGKIPHEVTFTLSGRDGSMEQVSVRPAFDHPHQFDLEINNLQKTLTYRVDGGDAISPFYTIEVVDPPVLRELRLMVSPPAYTGVDPYNISVDQLRIEEGAGLFLKGEANKVLTAATARFYLEQPAGNGARGTKEIERALMPEGVFLEGDLGILNPRVSAMSVHMLAADGIKSVNDTRHTVAWKLDKPPEILVEAAPKNGVTVVSGRSLSIGGRVLEDYALSELNFKWSMAGNELSSSAPIKITDSGDFRFQFLTGKGGSEGVGPSLMAESGDRVEWWVEAVDNSALDRGPQRTETERKVLNIVSREEKIAELLAFVRENVITIKSASEQQKEARIRLRLLVEEAEVFGDKTPESNSKP